MKSVELDLVDVRYVRSAIDDALSELEAAVADGDVDESILIGLSDAYEIVNTALKGSH